jgi:hypothetical protein
MSNNNETSCNPASEPADRQHDAHRAIADEWLRRAIDGIKEMHGNEDTRKEVAQKLF